MHIIMGGKRDSKAKQGPHHHGPKKSVINEACKL